MKKNPLMYMFISVILIISLLDFISPDKKFSEFENRNLKSKMKFTIKSYLDGSFGRGYEKYINDQFIGRDLWINLKSRSEYVLGKVENNNIIYGDNGYLFEKFTYIDKERLNTNINAVNALIKNSKTKVSLLIAPNSYGIYEENLPYGAPVINQAKTISMIYESIFGENEVNVLAKFMEEKDEYIYYKTDHHWTTKGAYVAYSELIKTLGQLPIKLNDYKTIETPGFYGTYYSKAKPFDIDADKLSYYEFSNIKMTIGDKSYDSLYDISKLMTKDKYSVFLYGNNPLTIIENTEIDNDKKLLIFKDSYANSLIPFLTQHYKEIHVIDPRSFNAPVSQYIRDKEFNDIFVIYNFINFTRDMDVVKLRS